MWQGVNGVARFMATRESIGKSSGSVCGRGCGEGAAHYLARHHCGAIAFFLRFTIWQGNLNMSEVQLTFWQGGQ